MHLSWSNIICVAFGERPSFCEFMFENVVYRAQRIFGECSGDSLEDINELGWIHIGLDPDRFFPEKNEEVREISPADKDATVASLVFNHMDEIATNELRGYTWPQYFALLALHNVHLASFWEGLKYAVQDDDEMAKRLPETLAFFLAEAVEAVRTAEQLEREENQGTDLEQQLRRRLSERGAMAAKKRHAKVAKLKQEFINYYESGDFPSQAEAARKFASRIAEQNPKILAEGNAERTLLDALRAHKKASKGAS